MSDNDLEGQGDGGGKTQECPICGAENAAGAAECAECSFTFEAEQPTDIVCQGCGAELPAGTESCFICGADIGSGEGQVAPEGELPIMDTEPGESPGPETSESLVCAGCGAELPVGTESCFICGAEVGEPVPEGELPIVDTEPPETSPEEPEPAIAEAEEEDVPTGEPADTEILFCDGCGAKLAPGTPTCMICGTDVKPIVAIPETPADDTLPDEAGRVPEESLMCKGCGAEISAGIPICPVCDTEVDVLDPETPESDAGLSGEDWDLGVVGGETAPDAEEPVEEPPEPGENEFICPSCGVPIAMGVSKCPECWVEIPEMFRCPGCSNAIPLESTSCPECFAKLQDGVLIEEPELPVEAEEPEEDLMPEEDFEELVEEETTEEVIGPGDVYTMECPFCHAIANASEDICPECGMPLIEEEEEEEEERPTLARKRDEPDWYRMIAIGVVLLLLISGILPFAFPLPQVDRAQIRIDGSFDDWSRITGMDDATLTDLPANVDIISYKMLSDAFNIYFYIEVRGVAFGDTPGNTARIFIDTDQDPDTGYSIMGLGADYQIRVFGHGGTVASSSCLGFDDARAQNDFNGFETSAPSVPHAAQSPDDSGKFEVRVSLEDIGITRDQPVTAVFYMADSIGNRDYSDTPLANQGSVLFARQSSLVPESGLLTGTSARALNLEVQAIGNPVTIDDITVPDCTVSQYDRVMNSSAVQDIVLTTNAASQAAGSFIHREASAADFTVPNTHVVVVGQGAHAYARSAPSTIQIDGAFADWNGKGMTQEDARDDVMAKNAINSIDDPALDMLNQTTQVENNNLNIMIETAGDMFAGMWVPELEESYVFTPTTRAEDRSQPDNVFTEPPVTRTRQAESIERPTEKPEKTGEGKVRVFIDSGASATGYRIDGINADYLIEIMGQDGRVTGTTMYRFQGTDPNMESWTEISANVLGAASGSRVEMAIPLSGFSNTANNATAVIQLVDWNMNGDVSDLTAWDMFQSGDREGTRTPSLPSYIYGSVSDSSGNLLRGSTAVARESNSGHIASFITYTDPNATGSNYLFNFVDSDGELIYLYASNGSQYGVSSVTYPSSGGQRKDFEVSSDSAYIPGDFTLTNLAPLGTDAIELAWTAGADPDRYRIFRTNNTQSEGGWDEAGRHYGSYVHTITSGSDRSYQDLTPELNQMNWYIIRSESGTGFNYSAEVGIMADFMPPVITHANVTEWYASFVPIRANITDGVGVQHATVYYRKQGESTFSHKDMSLISGNPQAGDWEAIIPLEFDGGKIIYEYYILANDGTFDSLHGDSDNPITLDAAPAPDEPYPIYGYVYWNNTPPTPVPGADVFISWVNKTGSVINEPGAFPVTTNEFGQYSVDMLDYDSNSIIWANATIDQYRGYNITQVVITDGSGEGERVDIYLETPILNITKDAPATANPGETITYTITVENIGNSTAYNVTVNDTYPSEVEFVGSSIPPTDLNNDTWYIGTLEAGQSYVLTIDVVIDPAALIGSTILNRADVVWNISDGTPWGTDYDTAATVIGAARLNLTKWAPATANTGQEITYLLNYTNIGSEAATSVVITEFYPPEVEFVSSTPDPDNLGNDTWTIDLLNPGDRDSIPITVRVNTDAVGPLENTANMSGLDISGTRQLEDAWAWANTTIIDPLMQISKTGPGTANTDETIMYTISYFNAGDDDAHDVWIYETYPDGVSFVNATPDPVVGDHTWFIGAVPHGTGGVIYINVTVDNLTGTLNNRVLLEYEDRHGEAQDPVESWWGTVIMNPQMTLSKSAPPRANPGQQITYSLYYENVGNQTAYDVVISEQYPAGVSFVGSLPDDPDNLGFGNDTWTIGTLLPGESGTITITVLISGTATGNLENRANVTYEDAANQILGPIWASNITRIVNPRMTISKTGPVSANAGQEIVYWVNYSNTGTDMAHDVVITENYPPEVTFVNATLDPDNLGAGNNTWTIGQVAANTSGSIEIRVLINEGTSGLITNHVTLDYNNNVTARPTEHAWWDTTVNNPLMTVSKEAPVTANPGAQIEYEITYRNTGTHTAYNVVITETYPAYPGEVTFVSATLAPDTGSDNTTWTIWEVPANTTFTFWITVEIASNATGVLNNSVILEYRNQAEIQQPEVSDFALTYITWPVMEMNKTAPVMATTGEYINYWIHYINTGNDTAYDVTITETYPAGVMFVNSTPDPDFGSNNTWYIGNLAPGVSGSIHIRVRVRDNANGWLNNTAVLKYDNSADMSQDPVTATASTLVGNPAMEISKTGPATATAGATIMYTVRYWNNGTVDAHNVTITDAYPDNVTFQNASPAPSNAANDTWFIGVVPVNGSGVIFINVTISADAEGQLLNVVEMHYENPAEMAMPPESGQWVTYLSGPLMTVEKSAPATANPGQIIMYTITYENTGNATAHNVSITDVFPAGVEFLNSNPDRASDYVWVLGNIAPGATGTIFINVTVSNDTVGWQNNTAVLDYENAAGLELPSVSDMASTWVHGPALQITKTAPAFAHPGQEITYWIYCNNTGTDGAYDIYIFDFYPEDVRFVSSLPAPLDANNNSWYRAYLGPNGSFSIRITVVVEATFDILVNLATAHYNNSAGMAMEPVNDTAVTEIVNPHITLEKTAATHLPGAALPGETFVYTIRVWNSGTDTAYHVRVREFYPAGVTFNSAEPNPENGTNYLWIFPVLAPGEVRYINITVTVNDDATGWLNNSVRANYRNSADMTMTPEWANHTLQVVRPNLNISKTAPLEANTGQSITYMIGITNTGSAAATGIVLTEAYPDGVEYQGADRTPVVPTNNVWNVGTLQPGQSWYVNITVRVRNNASGSLINVASAAYNDPLNQPYNPVPAQASTQVVDPYLEISKSGPTEANTGQIITYVIVITNSGSDIARNVVLTETYPPETDFHSAYPMPDFETEWQLGDIDANATVTILVNVTIKLTASGNLTNKVEMNYRNSVRQMVPAFANFTTAIIDPDMSIVKQGPATANRGQIITYWLNYTNTGTDWAYNVVVTEVYHSGVTFVSATPDPSNLGSGNNTWNIGSVLLGGSIMIRVRVNNDAVGILRNLAHLDYMNSARAMDRESDYLDTRVIEPLLIVEKSAPATANNGQTIVYTITIENRGDDAAYDVWVYESYPTGVSPFWYNHTPEGGTNNRWYFDNIPANGTIEIEIWLTVSLHVTGDLVNNVRVNYTNSVGLYKPEAFATATTTVINPILHISKDATPYANETELITYWINITNTGNDYASHLWVNETYPNGVTFFDSDRPSTNPPTNTVWYIPQLGPNAIWSLTITVQVNPGVFGVLRNRVDLEYQNEAGVEYDLWDTAETVAGDTPYVDIGKTAPEFANNGEIIMYTITYRNLGNVTAYNVVITESYPDGASFFNSNPIADNPGAGDNIWSLGNLPPGASGTIFVNVTVTGYGTITDIVQVDCVNSSGVVQPTRWAVADTTVRDPLMEIHKTAPLTANIGDFIVYSIYYRNIGNDTAYNVIINDIYPIEVDPGLEPNMWNIGSVEPGVEGWINVTVQVTDGGVVVNTVTLDYDNAIPVAMPQVTDTATTIVDLPGYVVVDKHADPTANPGGYIMYTIVYTNLGDGQANNVVITETYPPSTAYHNSSIPHDIGFDNIWTIGDLGPGESRTLFINVTVDLAATGTLMNQVQVDYTGGSDTAFANTTIVNPLMEITKTAPAFAQSPNPLISYTIQFFNNGTSAARFVNITETYPAGIVVNPANSVPQPTYGNNVWIIDSIPAGGSGTITIWFTVDAGIPLGTALVNDVSLIYYNDATVDMGTVTAQATTVITDVIMSISKVAPQSANPGDRITYTIEVYNDGPADATNVVITENYPPGVSFFSSDVPSDGGLGLTWTFATISAYSGITINIQVDIDITAFGILENRVMLEFDDTVPIRHTLNATASTVVTGPLMIFSKTVDKTIASPGETLLYTIYYENIGPGYASNVVITDLYPAGVSPFWFSLDPDSGNNVWNIGSVAPGASGVILIEVLISSDAYGTLTNWAYIDYRDLSGVQMDRIWGYAQTTIAGPSMRVWKNGPETANPGQIITFWVNYTNFGMGMARNVVIRDSVPAGFAYHDSDGSFAAGVVTWTIGDVAGSASGSVWVQFTVTAAAGVVNNIVTLDYRDSSGTVMPQRTANWAVEIVQPQLSLTKWAPATAHSGQYIYYWINVTNIGTDWARNIVVTDTYPPEATFVSATPANDTGFNNRWTIAYLEVGATVSIRVLVRINTDVANDTLVRNEVNLAFENLAGIPFAVGPIFAETHVLDPILTITKTGPATANNGQTITYTITVRNIGGATAYNIRVTENYPAGVEFLTSAPLPNQNLGFGNNVWVIDSLDSLDTFTITITVRINSPPSTVPLNNTVTATYRDASDQPRTPVQAWLETTVIAPELTVTKTGPFESNTGQNITYTITVTNTGTDTAYNVNITEEYSDLVSYVGASLAPTYGNNVWMLPMPLAPGESYTLTVTVSVNVQGTALNRVHVYYQDSADQDQPSASASWTTVVADPMVEIFKTTRNRTVTADGYILYNITFTNVGDGTAYNITITEMYPMGATYVIASMAPSFGDNMWNITSLAPGETGWLEILVRVNPDVAAGTVLNNSVTVDYLDLSGRQYPSESDFAISTVVAPAMQIQKHAPAEITVGDIFNYTITYSNAANADWAHNVVIRDYLPLGISILAMTQAPDDSTLGYLVWRLGPVAPGENASIMLTVLVEPNSPSRLINNVSLVYENDAGMLMPILYSETVTVVHGIIALHPPSVTSTPPAYVWAGDEFFLYADTMSFGADIDTVMLYFTDIFGESRSGAMVPLLVSSNGSGIYRLEMPAQPYKGFVSYFVWVNDTNGNQNRTGIFDVPVRLPPYLVWGNVYSHRNLPVSNAMVLITDVQTNETVIAYTDSNGRYRVDLGTLYSGYMDGEDLTVFATDGSYYGSNVSYIDVGAFDDQSLAHPNRRVNIVMNEIPEFAYVLIPLIGMLVLVAFLVKRRRKEEDEADF